MAAAKTLSSMNYLAHIFLAKQSNEAMLGALLGDFVKADIAGKFTLPVETEIRLHRKIDSYTDHHPVTQEARTLFQEGRRRYAGILLDVFYDHLLAKNWSTYCDMPLATFIQQFYETLDGYQQILPDRLVEITPWMIRQDWLGSYQDYQGVETAIRRMSTRLSKNGHLLREGLLDLQKNYAFLASGFDRFFPELMQFAEEERKKFG
jgi:acyl carrier protein phosphodiesterase